jgi:hypothetical protein
MDALTYATTAASTSPMVWLGVVPGAPQKQKSSIELKTPVWHCEEAPSVVELHWLSTGVRCQASRGSREAKRNTDDEASGRD